MSLVAETFYTYWRQIQSSRNFTSIPKAKWHTASVHLRRLTIHTLGHFFKRGGFDSLEMKIMLLLTGCHTSEALAECDAMTSRSRWQMTEWISGCHLLGQLAFTFAACMFRQPIFARVLSALLSRHDRSFHTIKCIICRSLLSEYGHLVGDLSIAIALHKV